MRRCLIVANQTLTTDTLTRAVDKRIAAEPHHFFVVAPATPAPDEVDGPAAYAILGPSATDRAYALAQQRLDRALEHLRGLGAAVDGEVGDPDPLQAVRLPSAASAPTRSSSPLCPAGCPSGSAGSCRRDCARAATSQSPTSSQTPAPDHARAADRRHPPTWRSAPSHPTVDH